jgi:hypothetical protein
MNRPIHAPGLYPVRRPAGRTKERDAYLRENAGVCPAVLAAEMKLSESFVIRYLIKLGLRKCTPSGRISKRNDGLSQ